MSMAATAVAATAVGVGAQIYGGIQASNAAKGAAGAQQSAADRYSNYVSTQQTAALGKINTPQQLAASDTALQAQEGQVKRMEALASNLDPALLDAGKQMTQLLQGHAAPVLGQIQAQRDLQRKQMLDQLRTQMGPGAETSSAGMLAMQQFDMQTSNMMNDVQQQYLDKVSNLALGGSQTLSETLNRADSTLGTLRQQSPEAQSAELIAKFTNPGAQAQEAQVQAAGGQYAGQQILGQTIGNVGGSLMSAGAMMGAVSSFKNPATPGQGTSGGMPGAGASENAQFTMPEVGKWDTGMSNPSLLGGSVNAPVVARSSGVGYSGPLSPSYMGYSGPSQSYATMPYKPFTFDGSGGGTSNIAGGGR